jgi:type II secretory pathway pseudopilin PulG
MGRRIAFTVFEVLVSLALLAIVSAVVIPALMGRIRDARTSALGQTLFSISLAIFEYKKAVTVYPPQLIYLSQKPAATVTDACGTNQIGATNANNWRGPYITRELVTNGINIGDALIVDAVSVSPGVTPTRLFINVSGVDTLTAVDLERQFDGTPENPVTGTLRYQKAAIAPSIPAASAGQVNVQYGIAVASC